MMYEFESTSTQIDARCSKVYCTECCMPQQSCKIFHQKAYFGLNIKNCSLKKVIHVMTVIEIRESAANKKQLILWVIIT